MFRWVQYAEKKVLIADIYAVVTNRQCVCTPSGIVRARRKTEKAFKSVIHIIWDIKLFLEKCQQLTKNV